MGRAHGDEASENALLSGGECTDYRTDEGRPYYDRDGITQWGTCTAKCETHQDINGNHYHVEDGQSVWGKCGEKRDAPEKKQPEQQQQPEQKQQQPPQQQQPEQKQQQPPQQQQPEQKQEQEQQQQPEQKQQQEQPVLKRVDDTEKNTFKKMDDKCMACCKRMAFIDNRSSKQKNDDCTEEMLPTHECVCKGKMGSVILSAVSRETSS